MSSPLFDRCPHCETVMPEGGMFRRCPECGSRVEFWSDQRIGPWVTGATVLLATILIVVGTRYALGVQSRANANVGALVALTADVSVPGAEKTATAAAGAKPAGEVVVQGVIETAVTREAPVSDSANTTPTARVIVLGGRQTPNAEVPTPGSAPPEQERGSVAQTEIGLATEVLADPTKVPPTDTPATKIPNVVELGPTSATSPTPQPSPTPGSSAVEQLRNSDFKDGLDDWFVDGAGRVEKDAKTGQPVLVIGKAGGYVDQRVMLTAGETWTLEVTAHLDGTPNRTTGTLVIVDYRDKKGDRLSKDPPTQVEVKAGDPQDITMEIAPPKGAEMVIVAFYVRPGKAALVIDRVSLRGVVG